MWVMGWETSLPTVCAPKNFVLETQAAQKPVSLRPNSTLSLLVLEQHQVVGQWEETVVGDHQHQSLMPPPTKAPASRRQKKNPSLPTPLKLRRTRRMNLRRGKP